MQPGRAIGLIAAIAAIIVIKAAYVGMAVWLHAVYPDDLHQIGTHYRTRSTRCFIVGFVNTALLAFIGALLVNTKIFALLGLLVWGLILIFMAYGYAVAYRQLGSRFVEPGASVARTVAIGGITAELAFLTPVLGQLFSLGVLFRGIGAVVLARLSKRITEEEAQATQSEEVLPS